MPPKRGESGFSLLEILAVVAVIFIIAAIGIPQIMGMRNKAKTRACDALYHELDSEIANALDNLIWSSTEIIAITLQNHTNERNPRERGQKGYVTTESGITGVPAPQELAYSNVESCQVMLSTSGPLTIVVAQAPTESEEGGAERSFRIGIDADE